VTFQPGQSGNPGGRSKSEKLYRDALRKAILDIAENDPQRRRKIELIAEAHVAKAMEGDVPAINSLADRLDGKPAQAITGDDDNGPLIVKILRPGDESGNA
jgi:hypothetical protein